MNFLQRKPLPNLFPDLFVMVNRWDTAKELVRIRNECRDGMTHNTEEITLNQQKIFFDKHLHPEYGDGEYLAYLLIHNNLAIGYAGLRLDGEKYWMTIGVSPIYRNRGYAEKLTRLITQMAVKRGKEVWLDCWNTSLALRAYLRSGYEVMRTEVGSSSILLIMKYKGN